SIIIYINEENAEVMNLTPEGAYFRAVTYHGNSRAIIQKLVKFNELGTKKDVGSFYRMNNEVSYLVENVGDFLEIISRIFVVVGIIFAVFASLLFLNFITLSVAFKKQEIGILRAIGARGIDVATIFMNEAGIIALINLILSFMLAIIAGTTINNYIGKNINIYLSIVNVGLRQLLLLILIAFGVAFISSFIPVFRLSRKKPIDAIRMR
ncbi:MAG: FtsX-like permease family protein, partial [Erysipelotrichaceae bacterium]|nr:FtsX-like permease family protein [Erysipelotrichaceae bacterium]